MNIELLNIKNEKIVLVNSSKEIIKDTNTALDFFANINYEYETYKIAINKEAFTKEFFDLKTKIAGDIFQKVVNYNFKLGIYGDFKNIESKALRDFILESNKGNYYCFVNSKEEAIEKLLEYK